MIGIILVTHGSLGRELINSAQMIVGDIDNITAISFHPSDDLGNLQFRVSEAIEAGDEGQGVLVLVDLLGGSPCNATAYALKDAAAECVTGLSMPLLINALEAREKCSLKELPDICVGNTAESVVNVKKHYGIES